jgi:predicted HicB family RNase H-like nuclease
MVFTAETVSKIKELAPKHNAAEIAKILGLRQGSVTSFCSRFNIELGRYNSTRSLQARVTQRIFNQYVKEAEKRKMSLPSLVCNLLTIIAKDNLFVSILETEEEENKGKK